MNVYYDHVCACGCSGLLEMKPNHKWNGVPRYINGHNRRGKTQSEESNRKRSASMKGKNTGRKLGPPSPETIVKRSVSMIGKNMGRKLGPPSSEAIVKNRIAHTGDKNPSWIDGRSFEPYSPAFNEATKQRIRERDGNICQCCDRTREEEGRELSVHHIDYDKDNCNDNNLITLCRSCNGKANGNALNRHMYMRVFQQKLTDLYGYKYN